MAQKILMQHELAQRKTKPTLLGGCPFSMTSRSRPSAMWHKGYYPFSDHSVQEMSCN